MAGKLKSVEDIREALRETVGETRRDALVFSVSTILISLFLFGGAIALILMLVRRSAAGGGIPPATARGICTGANVFVGSMFLALLAGQKVSRAAGVWLAGSAILFAVLLGLSYLTPLPHAAPSVFWIAYMFIAFVLMGLLGNAYAPRDDYYLGWFGGRMDDPFTYRDDIDREHIALGFAVAIPRMLVASYGDLFANAWLRKGLEPRMLQAAAEVLHALGGVEPDAPQDRLRRAASADAIHILRWLDKLGLVRPEGGKLRLTSDGEKFIGISDWF